MNKKLTKYIMMCLLFAFNIAKAQYTVVMDFDYFLRGSSPTGSLISDGTYLYGTASRGGTNGFGTLYKIKHDGTGYTNLLNFSNTYTGRGPAGTFFFDGNYLYGTAAGGGLYDLGTLFKIKTDGTDYVKIIDFAGVSNGSAPVGSLTFDGTFIYGITTYGGSVNMGTLYKIKPDGTGYQLLIDFKGTANGQNPYEGVYNDGTYLYGTARYGGSNNQGLVYKIKKDGTEFSKLMDCDGANNGGLPVCMFVNDSANLYGMTLNGGVNNMGTLFKIKSDGTGYLKLLDFDGIKSGSYPNGSLIIHNNYLYGTTSYGGINDYGALFKIKTDGSNYLKLADFSYYAGSRPPGALLNDGTFLYGLTYSGGANNYGVLFKYLHPTSKINTIKNRNYCTIYPNPNNGSFTIQFDHAGKSLIEILNFKGQRILNTEIIGQTSLEIDMSSFAKGFYFMKIMDEQGISQIQKFIIE